ncbi:MAG: hypothetical protein JSR87_12585 [Proteobacteria bacterium]|nr:hypothetical protein [Pseudomonadota bacterium]MBS0574451.1 hypothetical protein [Pseudomonadota bacterium]
MKRTLLPLVAVLSLAAGPILAAGACTDDLAKFDAAAKTSSAKKADMDKALTLRNEAAKDCKEKGGTKKGAADLDKALKLIGAKS